MRRIATMITTLALAMSGMVFSPAQAAVPVPANGTYLCATGAPSSSTPNYTITNGVVYAGGTCAGSVVIAAGVTSIGLIAFQGSRLTSISIPSSVTSIAGLAFNATGLLTSITIPSSVTSIGEQAFTASALTSITIPSSVTSIGHSAFSDSQSLTSVTIPSSVTSIPDGMFSESTSLTSVTIPSSVTSIGSGAFSMTSLTSVTIPSSVTSIGHSAFYRATALGSIYYLGNAPATVDEDAFFGVASGAKAYIKSGATGFANVGTNWNGLVVEVGVYTVSYNTTGGSSISAQGFRGNIAEPSAPTRTGYTFAGWSATDGGSVLTFPYTPTSNSDLTLYAKWNAIPVIETPVTVAETPVTVVDNSAAIAAAAELAARTIRAKKSSAAKSLAKQVGIRIVSSKATVSISPAKSSKKICTKSGSKLRTIKAGNCVVTFTVQEPKPKKGKKPKATKTVKTLVVR
jgi:uncharacterized repeat protein (TIGR02543 family)